MCCLGKCALSQPMSQWGDTCTKFVLCWPIKSLEWRRSNRIDDLLDVWTPPTVLQQHFLLQMCGQDKFGCPCESCCHLTGHQGNWRKKFHFAVWINCYGRMDTRGLLQSVTKRDYLRYIIYIGERNNREMRKVSHLHKRAITQSTMIVSSSR